MRTPVIDGQSIDQFIPAHLRDMFYKNPIPQYRYATHNGYPPYGFTVDGLVLYLPLWALNNGGTEPIQSVDAFKHTGTITGAIWQPNSRYFDGADDKVDCGNAVSLQMQDAITAEAWVRKETADVWQYVVAKDGAVSRNWLLAIDSTNKISVYIWVGGVLKFDQGTTVLDSSVWYHIGFAYDRQHIRVYVNGSLDADPPTVEIGQIDNDAVNLTVGIKADDTNDFKGYIGEVRVYNRALSAAEIANNRNATMWRY